MNRKVKRYTIISDNWDYVESPSGGFIDRDDYEALEAENAKLRAELERRVPDGFVLVPCEPTPEMVSAALETECNALRVENDRLRAAEKDAARYRWLRAGCDHKTSTATHIASSYYGLEWDAAIDTAMKGEAFEAWTSSVKAIMHLHASKKF